MLLIGVKEENGWLVSRWNLTYGIGWKQICHAAGTVYDYYVSPEILVDGKPVEITDKPAINEISESSSLTIRGLSSIFKVPMTLTFYNQLKSVDASVAQATAEFKEADYQKFNMAVGQFMDSVELAMYQ